MDDDTSGTPCTSGEYRGDYSDGGWFSTPKMSAAWHVLIGLGGALAIVFAPPIFGLIAWVGLLAMHYLASGLVRDLRALEVLSERVIESKDALIEAHATAYAAADRYIGSLRDWLSTELRNSGSAHLIPSTWRSDHGSSDAETEVSA